MQRLSIKRELVRTIVCFFAQLSGIATSHFHFKRGNTNNCGDKWVQNEFSNIFLSHSVDFTGKTKEEERNRPFI